MIKKISDKDKKDWENFIFNKEKVPNKDFISQKKKRQEKTKKIDLHGYSLEEANKSVEDFIKKVCHFIYTYILFYNVPSTLLQTVTVLLNNKVRRTLSRLTLCFQSNDNTFIIIKSKVINVPINNSTPHKCIG